jgi:UDP-N-acetylglucosamine--N-acetylmuramyl-(pentapeptide) pyrophosphoryl-undecaprenol N-acetylglucosamine transferase
LARRALLVAGGTGGHLFPALALREVLIRRGWVVNFVTDPRVGGMISGVPAEEVHRIQSATLGGRSVGATMRSLMALARGVMQSRRLLKRFRPGVVVGFGGYPTVPPAVAARLAHVPIVAHEQNAVVGRANRLLAKLGATLATGFRDPKGSNRARRSVYVGNPVRKAIIEAVKMYEPPLEDEPFRLLVVGGSQGAHIFSELVPGALMLLPPDMRLRVVVTQQARPEDVKATKQAYTGMGVKSEVAPFFKDIGERLANAHLIICRAGASTVAELAVIGRPAILVPYPHALDQDQAENAHVLSEAGGGWLMPELQLTVSGLAKRLGTLIDQPEELEAAAEAALSVGRVDAAERLADLIEEAAGETPVA